MSFKGQHGTAGFDNYTFPLYLSTLLIPPYIFTTRIKPATRPKLQTKIKTLFPLSVAESCTSYLLAKVSQMECDSEFS